MMKTKDLSMEKVGYTNFKIDLLIYVFALFANWKGSTVFLLCVK